mgnify:CR=1 FL=1
MSSKEEVPWTQGRSRKILIGMFKAEGWEDRGDCRQVLAMLRKYPELANKKFWTNDKGKWSAVFCLLLAYQSSSCSASMLCEVYDMHPQELQADQGYWMLRHICHGLERPNTLKSEKVFAFVRFIFGKVAPLHWFHCGYIPLDNLLSIHRSHHALLTTQAGLDTLKLFVELCPAVLKRTNALLAALLNYECSDEVAAFLAKKYSDREQMEELHIFLKESLFCSEQYASILKIMAHTMSLIVKGGLFNDLPPPSKPRKLFVKYLAESQSMTSLQWFLPQSWSDILTCLLKANTSLRRLEIRHSSDSKNLGRSLSLLSTITESTTLTSLTFGEGSFDPKMRLPSLPFGYQGSLQELKIDCGCNISHDLVCDLLSRLAMRAKVTIRKFKLVNEDLLLFIFKHTHVEYLEAEFSVMDLNSERVCEALEENRAMRTVIARQRQDYPTLPSLLKVLMERNCTLVNIRDGWNELKGRDIRCMLELNQKNRVSLHDPEAANISHLVSLLMYANDSSSSWSCNPQYALLRSVAGLWSRF